MDKLLAIRRRIIGDFNHHVLEIDKFTEASSGNAIAFREIAFEKSMREFHDVNAELDKIQSYHQLDNIDDVLKKNRDIEDQYLTIKSHLSELRPENETVLNSTFFPATAAAFDEREGDNSLHKSGAKLPPIQLKPFDGKFEEWSGFKDLFLALMKKQRGDDVEKLSHLRNHLRGEALDVVKHLSVRNGHYEVALDLLKSHYENTSAVIDSHLRTFMDIPTLTYTSAKSIRHAITTTQGCLAAIKELDIIVDTWDPMIVYVLKNKLDGVLRDKWEDERKGSHTPATLNEFLKFLTVRQRVIISLPQKPRVSTPNAPSRTTKTFVSQNEGDMLLADNIGAVANDDACSSMEEEGSAVECMAQANLSRQAETCLACGHKHRVFLCPKLTKNADDALVIVNEKGLCTNCLYKHDISACTSKGTCRVCQARHHTLLHDALQHVRITTNIQQTCYVNQTKQTLLATAVVPVHNAGVTIYLRALIDQGSMINMITEHAARILDCIRVKSDISLVGIANTNLGVTEYTTTVTLGSLYDKTFQLDMETLISENITSLPLVSSDMFMSWTHLNGLQLADPNTFTHTKIDLLLGAQVFAKILLNGDVKGKEREPMAQKTYLGWIISGSCELPQTQHVSFVTNEQLSTQIREFWDI